MNQQQLDEQKYYESQKNGYDMSGHMIYCNYCDGKECGGCYFTQDERVANNHCEQAFNRMQEYTQVIPAEIPVQPNVNINAKKVNPNHVKRNKNHKKR